MINDSKKIGSKCFEEALLNNLSDTDKRIIGYVFQKNQTNDYYVLIDGITETVKLELAIILTRSGYKFNPIDNFNAFYNEIFNRHINTKAKIIENAETVKNLDNMESYLNSTREGLRLIKEKSIQNAREALFNQVIKQRGLIFNFLMCLMTIETIVLFTIVVFASISIPKFRLEINPATLQILVGATIAQISAMVIIIIHSVFPDSLNKILGTDEGHFSEKLKEKNPNT